MEISWIKKKRIGFTLSELLIGLFLLALILPTLGLGGLRFFKKWQFEQDIQSLKSQLQLAHDSVLHCQIPVHITLRKTVRGLYCQLNFENDSLDRKLPCKKLYKHIQKMNVSSINRSVINLYCCFSGGLQSPLVIELLNEKATQSYRFTLKGYPHVIHVEK